MMGAALDFLGYLAAALLGGLAGWVAFATIVFTFLV